MNTTVRLLFTNEDLGHYFDDASQGLGLIAKVARQEMRLGEHFATGTIGGSANEDTRHSELPALYAKWRKVYILDAKTYSTIYAVLDAFLNHPAANQ